MEEKKCGSDCEECNKRAVEEKENDEASLAILIAMMPLMVMTFFMQVGYLF